MSVVNFKDFNSKKKVCENLYFAEIIEKFTKEDAIAFIEDKEAMEEDKYYVIMDEIRALLEKLNVSTDKLDEATKEMMCIFLCRTREECVYVIVQKIGKNIMYNTQRCEVVKDPISTLEPFLSICSVDDVIITDLGNDRNAVEFTDDDALYKAFDKFEKICDLKAVE